MNDCLARLAFIGQKNWAEADRIRDELLGLGVQLKDGKGPSCHRRTRRHGRGEAMIDHTGIAVTDFRGLAKVLRCGVRPWRFAGE